MNTEEEKTPSARGFAASVPGAGHIRYGTPCQDASGVALAPRPAAIVCDGRGSAKLSHFGAQGAIRAFFSQLNVLEPFVAGVLDRAAPPEKWDGICRLFYRTLLQVKLDLAAERGGEEKDFDFTVAFAVAGKASIGCFQVGDGAIVVRQNGACETAFAPDKGEFANQTQFLRPGCEESGKFHARLFPAQGNGGVAITSDGPEHLMFRQADRAPGPIFGQMFDDLASGELCEQDIRDYLTRRVWSDDPRGNDDRSIAILLPGASTSRKQPMPQPAVPEHHTPMRPRMELPREEQPREKRRDADAPKVRDDTCAAPNEAEEADDEMEDNFDPSKVTDVIWPPSPGRPIPRGHLLRHLAFAVLLVALGFLASMVYFASCADGDGETRPKAERPEVVQPPVETNAVEQAALEISETGQPDPAGDAGL